MAGSRSVCNIPVMLFRVRKVDLGPIFEEFHRVLNAKYGPTSGDYFKRTDALAKAAQGIVDHSFQIAGEAAAIRAVVEAIRKVRAVQGPGCTNVENRLMDTINTIASYIVSGLRDPVKSVPKEVLNASRDPEPATREAHEGIQVMYDFGLESISYRRSHDSFGVKRRVLALTLFRTLRSWILLDEPLRTAEKMMASGKPKERAAALELLKACSFAVDGGDDE